MELANKKNKTVAQVMIRWCIDQGFPVIPKSVKEHRIYENCNIFDFKLEKQELKDLESLNQKSHVCWNPLNEEW